MLWYVAPLLLDEYFASLLHVHFYLQTNFNFILMVMLLCSCSDVHCCF